MRLAALLTQDRGAAEDVAQEALTAVYRQWDRLDAPAAYLRTCVVNAVRTNHRKRTRDEARLAKLGACGSSVDHADEISDALTALPYRQRAVLVLRYYDDLPEKQIAEILGCRLGTVKSRAGSP